MNIQFYSTDFEALQSIKEYYMENGCEVLKEWSKKRLTKQRMHYVELTFDDHNDRALQAAIDREDYEAAGRILEEQNKDKDFYHESD